jgi:predicted unusual protein kinase regulating ubiquinone biosynthesis (AarF/ABC1/UbiB family)
MVMDYEVAKYKPRMLESATKDGMELEALEAELEVQQKELEKAQIAYASRKIDSGMSPEQRKTLKESLKREMKQAATELAVIESKIAATEGESSKSQLHRKAANRLLDLCRTNGGVYIKVGQHLANLDYLIPQEYTEVLSTLFDDTPRSTYDNVCKVIEEDLGGKVDDIFDGFEKNPIASASLAQVHVAYDKKTGKKLAVKVQHRGLRETSVGDIFTVTKVVGLIDRWFEDFTFGWIADEIVPHLPKELDFTREGKNSEQAALHVAKTGLRCVIPKVIWAKTGPRVLTMEFEEGFKVTDIAAIEKSGLNKRYVSFVQSTFVVYPLVHKNPNSHQVSTPFPPAIFRSWCLQCSTLRSFSRDGCIATPIQPMFWFETRTVPPKWCLSVSTPVVIVAKIFFL